MSRNAEAGPSRGTSPSVRSLGSQTRSLSPSAKSRVIIDSDAVPVANAREVDDEEEEESCLICLGEIIDRSVLPRCLHSLFCFDCILRWIGIHRRCPLCSIKIDDYIIHSIRSDQDYIRHYLPTIAIKEENDADEIEDFDPAQLQADISQWEARRLRRQLQLRVGARPYPRTSNAHRTRPSTDWGESRVEERQKDAIANWDQRLAFRKKVYREDRYCLHLGSNSSTRLVSPPSSSVISTSKLVESTLLSFIRRELLAYPMAIDVDFLSRYTINLLKTFDCRSNEAIDLMAEFLGLRGAQHFCHELYSFCRFIGECSITSASGRQRDKVKAFDEWAQYELPSKRRNTKGEEVVGLEKEKKLKSLLLQRKAKGCQSIASSVPSCVA